MAAVDTAVAELPAELREVLAASAVVLDPADHVVVALPDGADRPVLAGVAAVRVVGSVVLGGVAVF